MEPCFAQAFRLDMFCSPLCWVRCDVTLKVIRRAPRRYCGHYNEIERIELSSMLGSSGTISTDSPIAVCCRRKLVRGKTVCPDDTVILERANADPEERMAGPRKCELLVDHAILIFRIGSVRLTERRQQFAMGVAKRSFGGHVEPLTSPRSGYLLGRTHLLGC